MTPEKWKAVARLFDQTLARPVDEREKFLADLTADDPSLKQEVAKLLSSNEAADKFLEKPAISFFFPNIVVPHSVLVPGELIASRFQVVRLLGEGGMGQVYEAIDLELQETIALKILLPEIAANEEALARFRKEVLLARRVTHPNVCRTFNLERHSRTTTNFEKPSHVLTFLTMELLRGETLAAFIERAGRLTTQEARPIAAQIIDALEAAHQVGVIHRDLKPSNIVLVPTTGTPRAVVTDFGVAAAYAINRDKLRTAIETSGGNAVLQGTLIYMAPEQLEGNDASPATDLYAFGLILYEMLAGRRPFASEKPFGEVINRLKQPPPPPRLFATDLDPKWESAILRCLETHPEDRFQTARTVLRHLADHDPSPFPRVISDRVPLALRAARRTARYFAKSRKRAALLLSVVAMSLLAVGIRLSVWSHNRPTARQGSILMLTQIENYTHDGDLDGTTELLRTQLGQSAYFNLLSNDDVRETEGRMGRVKLNPSDPQTAREIALRQNVPLVLFGTVTRLADDYKLDLKLEQVGVHPFYAVSSWTFGESAKSKKEFFEIVHHAGTWVRKTVGEGNTEISENTRQPEQATTDSWEALKLYSDGQRRAAQDDLNSAVLLFKQATDKDPQFAMAYMRIGDILDTLGNYSEGFSYWKKALAVSGVRQLAPREELRIRGMFANDTGDLRAAIDFFGQYSVAFPNDYLGFFYRAYPLMVMGKTEEAIRMLEVARKLNPHSYYIVDHLARYNLILGNFSESSRFTELLRKLGRDENASLIDAEASVLKGDTRSAQATFAGLHQSNDLFVRSSSYYLSASVFAERGQYQDAIEVLTRGVEVDARFGAPADQADKLIAISYLNLKRRDLRASREAALQALRIENGLRRSADSAAILARGGWIRDAQGVLANLPSDQQFAPLSESARLRVKGEIFLAQNENRRGLAAFRTWRSHDQETAFAGDGLVRAFIANSLTEDALNELTALRQHPGRVWHQAEAYFPGADADLLFLTATQAVRTKRPEARELLVEYCKRRETADSNLPEVTEALDLLRRLGN